MGKYFLSSYSGFSIKTWVTILATFVNAIGSAVPIFMALYLSTVLHFSVEHVAYIVSASGLGAIAGAFSGGLLCDRFNPYKVSIVMLIISGLSTCIITMFSQFTPLLVLMVLTGFSSGAFKPANTLNLLQDCPVADRAKINGLSRVAVNLGIGMASVIGGALLSISGEAMFWFDSISSWIAVIVLLYFSRLFKSATVRLDKIQYQNLSTSLLADKVIIFLCLLLFLNCIVFFQSWTTYPLYLNDYYHFNAKQFGYLFLLNCMMVVFLEVPILNAVKNCNQIVTSALGSLVLCFSLFILAFSANDIVAILSMVLLTIGEILLFSTLLALIINRSDESKRGKYIGLYQAMFSAANMLAPIVGGFIYLKSPVLLWYGCALIGVLCVIGFQLINLFWFKSPPELIYEVIQNKC